MRIIRRGKAQLDTCKTSAAMCCWSRDRQANDNNGNCDDPYDTECVDKGPGDNTDLCHTDFERGQNSTEYDSAGTAVFPHDDGNVNDGDARGEGRIHCHGFAWANDGADFTNAYKANNLFFVSLYDHMHQRGYVENVPGAPMCACVEQMPVVSRSDCTQIDVDESWVVTFGSDNGVVKATLTEIEIDFNGCQGLYNQNNDLWAYFLRLYKEGKVNSGQLAKLSKVLVEDNNCEYASRYELAEQGYTVGYEPDNFVQVAGRDMFDMPSYGKEAFNKVLNASPNNVVMRVCATCYVSHKMIFYKRITDLTEDLDLLHELKNERNQHANNIEGVDFFLYGSYEAALADVNNTGAGAWDCNYQYWDYFPGNCGPYGVVNNQDSRFDTRSGKQDVAFYVETTAGADKFGDISEVENRADGMTSVDVGLDLDVVGNAIEHDDGTIHITGAGDDVWDTKDEFHYYYHAIPAGDFTLKMQILSFDDNNYGWAKAGLMVRDSLDFDSGNVFAYLSGSYGVRGQMRNQKGNITDTVASDNWPYNDRDATWLMLTRSGSTYTIYESDDGEDWAVLGNPFTKDANYLSGDQLYAGIAITSHLWNQLAEAVVSNYTHYNQASTIKCLAVFEDTGAIHV